MMTEKRFTIGVTYFTEAVEYTEIFDNGKPIMEIVDDDNIQDIIDLLNEQEDRIKELEKENTFLKEALEACTLDIKVAMQTLSRWE